MLLNLCEAERTTRQTLHLALVLSLVAGILNSVGFVAVAKYTSHMTGIIASVADATVLGVTGIIFTGVLAVVAFVLGAVVCALVFNWGRRRRLHARYANILMLEGCAMLLFGLLAETFDSAYTQVVVVIVICFTMGLQNALITRIGDWPIRTTHVTGMVTDIGAELGKILYPTRAGDPDPVRGEPRRVWALIGLVATFFLGGLLGAAGYLAMGFQVIVLVAALLMLMSYRPLLRDVVEKRRAATLKG
ncbi:MAG: YoaK family protein [Micrococcus sp.]|nr:YoaK family protein [Micrococcus sp.]